MTKTVFVAFCICFYFLVGSLPVLSQEMPNEVHFIDHPNLSGYGKKKRNNSTIFQGNKKKKKYFEGWYFKMVSADDSSILSVIPGISISEDGETQHAFIQIINGKTAETDYYSFPIEDFYFSEEKFAVRIGNNYFSEDSLVMNIQNDSTSIVGTIRMSNQVHLSENSRKGIMGWYRFVPFMQCYHGVVSLNHDLSGTLLKNGKSFNFDDGVGYIEKDWGKSMPSAWIWIQSNNFSAENSSFMLSVAHIPWLGSSFTGFLGFFLQDDGTIHRFATYTKAKINVDPASADTLRIAISSKTHTYLLEAYRSKSGLLKAPVEGSMDRRIAESVDAKLLLTVLDENDRVIFQDRTSIAGLETVGEFELLTGKKRKRNKK